MQNAVGEEAEVDSADGRDSQDAVYSERKAHGPGCGDFGAGFAHVHHNDKPQIVVSADHAVDAHDYGQPDKVRTYSRFENVEFAEESSSYGQAEQRKKKQRQY